MTLRSWWCVTGVVHLSYSATCRRGGLEPPTSRRWRALFPRTVLAPARSRMSKVCRGRVGTDRKPIALALSATGSRRESNPRPIGPENRPCSGPQQRVSSRSWSAIGLRNRTATACTARAPLSSDNRAAPARDDREKQAHQDSNPDQRGWSSPCCRYTTSLCMKRTTCLEQAPPGWKPGAVAV